ncbi:MAG: hypothetical protein HPY69_17065 [Armatimonadetes bacterium]|nr:hypothetical protein [Armatimonadota bacterium]
MNRILSLVLVLASCLPLHARPIDPAIDEGPGPFSYFSRPSDVLGVADGDEGTQVTPEGWLWTGSAQLVFFAGPDLEPLRQRVRTLPNEVAPVLSYSLRREGIEYALTLYGATLDGRAESPLVNFIRVTMSNPASRTLTATFAVGFRGEGDHCCPRLRVAWNPYTATYEMGPTWAARDDQLIYTFPDLPELSRLILPDVPARGRLSAREGAISARTPVCLARYDLALQPGESRTLDFTMPYAPVPLSDREFLKALQAAAFDPTPTQTWWRAFLAQGMQIELPERKPVDTYQASLMYDAIARDKHGDDYIMTVNQFQYHYFWVRDGAYIANAFDLAGRHRWAEQGLEYFLKSRQPNGIIYQPPQLDGFGQTLWAFGSHWRLTGDQAWARRIYPHLAQHVRGVMRETRQDPLGLVPAAPPYDNEAINGHYTGHSFWLLIGLRDLIAMARTLGQDEDAGEFQAYHDEYAANFARALDAATEKTDGYIPPGLDAGPGCDWDNLIGLYPRGGVPARGALDVSDPRPGITATTVRERKYAEGLMTYGPGLRPALLHHYDTIKATHGLVTLNRQREALADFYALLVHTSSTHAGFEFGIVPWDNRDPGGNFPPHGWFAAEYIALLRNMLVREWDGDLHLLSVVSPEWLKPGSRLAVRRAPTDFGPISLTARVTGDDMTVRLSPAWRAAPEQVVLHLPWFVRPLSAECEGRPLPITRPPFGEGSQIVLDPSDRLVTVRWERSRLPELSYTTAVAAWKRENRRRYAGYTRSGGRPEALWTEASLPMTAEARREAWTALETQVGVAIGGQATASSSEPGHPPQAAVDGRVEREVYWGATPWPAWWQVDLGQERRIDRVRVVTYWGAASEPRHYQYRVLTSLDGANWHVVADASTGAVTATESGLEHTFAPVSARYVRVEMLRNSANTGVHLVEVMVFPAVEAPIAEAPPQSSAVWTAESQTGSEAAEMAQWGFIGAERIVLQGKAIGRDADRVRLVFLGGRTGGIVIGDVSLARTDPTDPANIIAISRVPITFGGRNVVDLPAGGEVASDWVRFPLEQGRDLSLTFRVLGHGATTLWADPGTRRYESQHEAAPLAARWSDLGAAETYNLYFLARIEAP